MFHMKTFVYEVMINNTLGPSASINVRQSTMNGHLVVINYYKLYIFLLIPQKPVQDFYFERGGRVMVSALSLGNSLRV